MNYRIFQISKSLIPNLEIHNSKDWEIYDEECKRKNISIDNNIFQKILKTKDINNYTNLNDNHLFQHIKYNLKNNNYHISKHDDNCKYTIIIYLNKTETISDKFFCKRYISYRKCLESK